MNRADVFDLAVVFDTSAIRVISKVTGQWQLTDEAREVIAAALRAYDPPSGYQPCAGCSTPATCREDGCSNIVESADGR